jgi:hypothetical protein
MFTATQDPANLFGWLEHGTSSTPRSVIGPIQQAPPPEHDNNKQRYIKQISLWILLFYLNGSDNSYPKQ